jgi:hypothetical protein
MDNNYPGMTEVMPSVDGVEIDKVGIEFFLGYHDSDSPGSRQVLLKVPSTASDRPFRTRFQFSGALRQGAGKSTTGFCLVYRNCWESLVAFLSDTDHL